MKLVQDRLRSFELNNYWARLQTFSSWNYKIGSCTGIELAKSGFHCTGRTSAKCYYCEKELDYWEPSDVPHVEHRKHAPTCPFVVKYPRAPSRISLEDMLTLEMDRYLYSIESARGSRWRSFVSS